MADRDPIAEAFTLFQRLRDQRTHRCDYRHSELAAFRMAVEALSRCGVDRPRKRKSRVARASSQS